MVKRFILRIVHDKGSATMLTNTPNLLEAVQQFIKRVKGTLGSDKDCIQPHILKASIEQLNYDLGEDDE